MRQGEKAAPCHSRSWGSGKLKYHYGSNAARAEGSDGSFLYCAYPDGYGVSLTAQAVLSLAALSFVVIVRAYLYMRDACI